MVADGPLRGADERLGRGGHRKPPPGGPPSSSPISAASPVAVPVLAAAVAYASWRGHRAGPSRWWPAPLGRGLAMAAVPALVIPLKELIGRTGPPGMDGTGYYPSGHTATAAVAYGGAALLLLPPCAAPAPDAN